MLKIIKVGGNIVDNPAKLQAFLTDFAALEGDKILVHGGGKIATAISTALGIETTMIDGRRVTDARTLEVVTMVYNGINKQIVSSLQSHGCNAVGLCGADGRLIVSKRRPPKPVDYGFVGDPAGVNTTFAQSLMREGYTLVVAPITLDEADGDGGDVACGGDVVTCGSSVGGSAAGGDGLTTGGSVASGGLLNTNADTVAQTLAVAMAGGYTARGGSAGGGSAADSDGGDGGGSGSDGSDSGDGGGGSDARDVELVYCFEKQGVLLDTEDENSVIPHMDAARFAELKASGAVHSGMLPKLENAFRALEKGVGRVVICAAENIAKPGYGGTTIGR